MSQNGKGDTPRPVNRKRYESNHDAINWKSKAQAKPQPKATPAGTPARRPG